MLRKKLKTMSVVCQRDDLDEILRDLILEGKCSFQNTMNRIEESNFFITLKEENAEEILEMKDIKSIKSNDKLNEYMAKITDTAEYMEYAPVSDRKYMGGRHNFDDIAEEIDLYSCKFENLSEEIENTGNELERLKDQKYLEKMSDIEVDLGKLMNMANFTAKIGFLSREKKEKLSRNYEKTFAVVLHIGEYEQKELYIIISPKKLDKEMGRILKSTDFHEAQIDKKYYGYPGNVIKLIKEDIIECEKRLSDLKKRLNEYLHIHKTDIDRLYSKMVIEKQIDSLKRMMVATEKYAYFSAVIPSANVEIYKNIFTSYEQILVNFKEEKNMNSVRILSAI